MNRLVCAVMVLLLTGCAAPGVIASNPRSVVVDGGRGHMRIGTDEAQKLADVECAKHQRFARIAARPDSRSRSFVFDCVQ